MYLDLDLKSVFLDLLNNVICTSGQNKTQLCGDSLPHTVHCRSRHGSRSAGGLSDSPGPAARQRRRGERRADCRPVALLEKPASSSEGEPGGPEPLGARPQRPLLEGGPSDWSQQGEPYTQRTSSPGRTGAGQSRTGETDASFSSVGKSRAYLDFLFYLLNLQVLVFTESLLSWTESFISLHATVK